MEQIKDYNIEGLRALLSVEDDIIAQMANTSAFINEALQDINWVGFYRLKDDVLKLAPFQGKVACYTIAKGRGVCGTAWEKGERQVVDDVHSFEGHIACDSASLSEVVIPLFSPKGDFIGVLDIDSPKLARFDEETVKFLQDCADIFLESIKD